MNSNVWHQGMGMATGYRLLGALLSYGLLLQPQSLLGLEGHRHGPGQRNLRWAVGASSISSCWSQGAAKFARPTPLGVFDSEGGVGT